ncbi:MAG: tetratricopeptide repeat protein [Acidobacteriales bacterium]|nr:tetratricopeptide repeat protein [Candidatus Koribacter versatilis]MBI3646614.1 tetratricopeptide repeat protein [Terriglobales bacterium]
MSLDTSETLFTVLTTINTCGYDQELNASDPLRAQIRSEVAKAVQNTPEAQDVLAPMCQLYREHQLPDSSRDLAQYVSLALYLQDPPTFEPKVKQAELPPDAAGVAAMVPFMKAFYEKVGLHDIWERHRARYVAFTETYHAPLSKMTFDTEIYLKLPSAGYLGRQFIVYLDAMGAPGQANARNYALDYFVVISPSSSLKMQQIRHTYLHYLLDPLALKNGGSFKRLEPLLDAVKTAPMDEAFKNNISLLVTECLARAIEARTLGSAKTPEAERLKTLDQSDQEGYVLTHYFYDALIKFEKDPAGLRAMYAEMLDAIDVGREMKRTSQIEFAGEAAPELLHLARPKNERLLLNAERRLSAGDTETAQKLAQQALDEDQEDPGRALFILAQVATRNRDMEGARTYFERALQMAHEPKVIAWSHIYLGRIFDLKEERDVAVDHYRAALNAAGAALPEAKTAAERGIEQPYEPPAAAKPQ